MTNINETKMTETDDYRLQARASFDLLAKRLEFVAKMQAEYGKWVVATLLFLHTSAIAGLLYKSEASSHPRALGCFAIGAAFAVITGAAAWINFTAAMFIYDKFCDVRMLVNSDRWPKADEVKTQHLWSCCAMYAAIACALISLIFWVTGAGLLLLKEFTDARMIQMALAKILSLAGILVELVGFAILAFELLRTNKDIASYANAIANKITTATTIIGRDSTPGETGGGGIEFTGGALGALSPSAKVLSNQVSAGKKRTLFGLALTGAGVMLQFIGTILG